MSGSIFGGGKQKETTTTTVQNNDPWSQQQPYLQDIFNKGQSLYNAGPYQGPFIGQNSAYSDQGRQMISDLASGKIGPSVNTNPYFQSAVNDSLGMAGSAFAKQYGGAAGQNLGNSGYQEALARGLGATANNMYANEYQNQLQNMYQGAGALMQSGQSQEARNDAQAMAQQQAFMSPWSNLANYRNAVAGNYGGTSNQTQTSPYFTNPAANALGMGLAGGSLFGMGKGFGWF